MWSGTKAEMNNNNNSSNILAARGFSTPPAMSWRSPRSPAMLLPMSERKFGSGGCKRDLFHVIHKVPSGDSPYVRAKHVQLIEKDPNKAISLFWAAINAGDRVDSALKDMAVVMKQLNRSDEAIEAIKSFRHLCPHDSQESIDNVLVELYKRSGRIEEEIEMLQQKLKDTEEGLIFGGKRTKIARSQGKKIQITIEQERSRILGNLAWAYLQHHDFGSAEQHYRKALSLEPDKNKQCNLAICLMHMNRIPEAKSLLESVRASCGSRQMDDSFAKSFERAVQMLTELESQLALTAECGDIRNLNSTGTELNYAADKTFASPAPVLYTQPRMCSSNGNQRSLIWGENTVEQRTENALARTIRNLSGELLDSTDEKSKITLRNSQSSFPRPTGKVNRIRSWGYQQGYAHVKDKGMIEYNSQNKLWENNVQENGFHKGSETENSVPNNIMVVDNARVAEALRGFEWNQSSVASLSDNVMPAESCRDNNYFGKNGSAKSFNKSWADMAEEEDEGEGEEEFLSEKNPIPCFCNWNSEKESDDENLDSNIIHQNAWLKRGIEDVSQKLEAFELKDGSNNAFGNAAFSRNRKVKRSLCFEAGKQTSTRRLQVFRDITPTPDSP